MKKDNTKQKQKYSKPLNKKIGLLTKIEITLATKHHTEHLRTK